MALELHPEFFSSELAATAGKEGEEGVEVVFRPGFLVDYLYGQADAETREVRGLVVVV